MRVKIITPERTAVDCEAVQVAVPGAKSPFAMRKGHQPIVSSLVPGKVKITTPDGLERFFTIDGIGVVEQHNDDITILAGTATEDQQA